MTRLIQRWYISILLIPIIVNLFTNTVSWDTLKTNPTTTFLSLSVILNVILIGELLIYMKVNQKENDTFQNDKKVLAKLIQTLNLIDNEPILKLTNHVDKLDYKYVNNIKEFLVQTNKLENRVIDKDINMKLNNFKQALNEYLGFIGKNMVTNAEDGFKTISMPYELKDRNYDLYMRRMKELDDSADLAYSKLKELMTTLRQRNVL